jgi:hypothetical protein
MSTTVSQSACMVGLVSKSESAPRAETESAMYIARRGLLVGCDEVSITSSKDVICTSTRSVVVSRVCAGKSDEGRFEGSREESRQLDLRSIQCARTALPEELQ